MITRAFEIETTEESLPVVAAYFSMWAEKVNSFETEAELRKYLEKELAKPKEVLDQGFAVQMSQIRKLARRTV